MKELYGEGIANHSGPESYAVSREAGGGALIRVRAGCVFSSEIPFVWGADAVRSSRRQHLVHRHREMHWDPTESKTTCTHGNALRENREISGAPHRDGAVGRSGKP